MLGCLNITQKVKTYSVGIFLKTVRQGNTVFWYIWYLPSIRHQRHSMYLHYCKHCSPSTTSYLYPSLLSLPSHCLQDISQKTAAHICFPYI